MRLLGLALVAALAVGFQPAAVATIVYDGQTYTYDVITSRGVV